MRAGVGPQAESMADKKDGSITDSRSGLTWQQQDSAGPLTWEDAGRFCAAPWRLPEIKDLQSINDESVVRPSVDHEIFRNTSQSQYWSSTTMANRPERAWTITLTVEQRKRLAAGYGQGLGPAKNWDLDALAGAGAIRSTANDMLKFLAANLELTDTPLKAAMRRMRAVRRETGSPGLSIVMAWHVWNKYGTEIIWHNGGTGGYRSFAGFDLGRKTGVVVLCNSFFDIDNLGLHILESQWPAPKMEAARERKEISVDPKILETYSGEYRFAPQFSIKVTTEGGRLFIQATGQPRVEVFAEKETEFFVKVVDAQITFVKDDSGKVAAMILHQNGANPRGEKLP